MRIIEIVATRCQILRLKCAKFNFGWGSDPKPCLESLQHSPDHLAGFIGSTSKGGEGKEGVEGSPLLFSADLRSLQQC